VHIASTFLPTHGHTHALAHITFVQAAAEQHERALAALQKELEVRPAERTDKAHCF
jgi:hypothetical protein